VPQEYWTIEADLEKDGQTFQARLHKLNGHKPELKDAASASAIVADALTIPFVVTDVSRKERKKRPPAPFTTSTMQQEAAKQLGFSAKRTMRAAQQLYEGQDIGEEGPVGLITYMRTDSTRVAPAAVEQARQFIGRHFAAHPPRHTLVRRVMVTALAPKLVHATEPFMREAAKALLDGLQGPDHHRKRCGDQEDLARSGCMGSLAQSAPLSHVAPGAQPGHIVPPQFSTLPSATL